MQLVQLPKMIYQLLDKLYILVGEPGDIDRGGSIDAQQVICGHLEQTSQLDNVLCRGNGDPLFPCVDAGTCNAQLFCQIRLRKTSLLSDCNENQKK